MSNLQLLHAQIAPMLEVQQDKMTIVLLALAGETLENVWLRLEPDNEEWLIPMSLIQQQGTLQKWQAEAPFVQDKAQTVYAFKVVHKKEQVWLDAAGTSRRLPLRERFFRYVPEYQPPTWVPQQVFYQIFPERFCNGDDSLSVTTGESQVRGEERIVKRQWGEPINPEKPNSEFFGGDLVGVESKLDYLEDLGVTALYLNPIFTSPSVHKYDCEDFLNVDPHLGGNDALSSLTAELHQRGMKILLDGVFNHTSDTHPWFNRWGDKESTGAYQSADSPYRHFYHFYDNSNPESYHCWQGSKVIPVLDLSQPQLRQYFYEGDHAVMRHWMRPPYNIDGWRMDVVHMMGDGTGAKNNAEHVKIMRAVIKQEDPDGYLLGEHFYEATRWLQGEQEDGAMNYYGFALPVRAFLAGLDVNYQPNPISAEEFSEWLAETRSRIPYANQLCQLNLLDSHDTTRFITMVSEHLPTMRLAVVLLITYPGVPCVYYGDEIGMTGQNDPFNRACMPWEESQWDRELRSFYQDLIAIRKAHPVFRTGAYLDMYAQGDGFAFARFDQQQCCVVAINRSTESPLSVPLDMPLAWFNLAEWRLLTGDNQTRGKVFVEADQLKLAPGGFAILMAELTPH